MKNLLFTFSSLILTALVYGSVSFDVACTYETVPANGIAEITISSEWVNGSNSYIIYTPAMPQLLGLKIIDHITFGQATTVNSQIIQRVVHLFKLSVTNNAGIEAETGPIFINYRLSGSKETHHKRISGVKFKVIGIKDKLLKAAIPVGAVFLLISIIAIIIIIRSSRKKDTKELINNSSVEDAIIEELEHTKRFRINGDIKRYFHGIDELIKKYFRKKYQIGSLLDVNPESNGKAGPDKHTLTTVRDLLKLSHNVCYADYKPNNNEQDRIYNSFNKLLMKNRPHKTRTEEEMYLREDSGKQLT